MSTTDFTPERSAAIRQLLIDTVADEPRRRKRLQILLTSVLSGLAIVLAGGTAALALSGVIRLGGDETPPAPMPTPTQTVTPTPTPTPTPTATERPIAVQTSLITPQDVTAPPARPAWTLDLPGSGDPCEQYTTIDIADGLALFQTGAVEVGDRGGCDAEHQNVSLSLVDTLAGKALWSRQWSWTVPADKAYGGTHVSTLVLGTSGHILVYTGDQSGGPHEVLALTDGRMLGSFDPGAQLNQWPVAVPGDSGDVVMTLPTARPQIARVDPLDFSHPRWTTALDGTYAFLFSPGVTGLVAVSYASDVTGHQAALVSVDDGHLIPGSFQAADVSEGVAVQVVGQPDGQVILSAVDPANGAPLWSRQKPAASSVGPVYEASAQPGVWTELRAAAGYLLTISAQSITLTDALTGTDQWTVDAAVCAPGLRSGYTTNIMDPAHDAITVTNGSDLCRLDAHTGAALPGPDTGVSLFGSGTGYSSTYWDKPGTGTALDLATGAELWTVPTVANERWFYAGGVLVRQIGNHIESIG